MWIVKRAAFCLLVTVIVAVLPFYYAIITSLKSGKPAGGNPFWPRKDGKS